ncbi:MAG: efflux RND transporter periplasmic adaptor subunit [Gammaproteobacteria bacterium]|nr:efflux RND transporter periplasmic adaptor subunit [Gammaproteobacteria bacterium]
MSFHRFISSLYISILTAGTLAGAAEIISVDTIQLQGKAVLGGTVIPYKEVTLSAQIPGRVEFIAGEVGDRFKAGDTLVAIEDDDLLAKRKSVMAQLANADAALRNTYVQYGRELYAPQSRSVDSTPGMGVPNMFDQMFTRNMANFMGIGSNTGIQRHADIYRSATGVNQAQAALLQAQSQLEEIDAAIRDARSIAPFDGVILQKQIEVGDTVQPGIPLVNFGHVKYLRIQAEVPASLAQYLRIGMFVPAYLDTARSRVDARVSQIYPLADPSQHTVTVKFDLPMSVPGGPGMYAEVMVPDGSAPQEPTVVIPRSALIQAGSLPGVLVVRDMNTSELRLVRLGSGVGRDHVTILGGLRPGERVIDNPPPGVSSGWMPGAPNAY